MVRSILLVGVAEEESEFHRLIGEFRSGLEFDVDVGFASLLRTDGAIRTRHAMIPKHHVVLDHSKPFRFRVAARSRRTFFALQGSSLVNIGARTDMPGLLIVPQHDTDQPPRANA